MTDIYTRVPINKAAAIATSQKYCSDEFLNNERQKIKVLGLRKAELANELAELKTELGVPHIKGSKYPPKIVRHYKFKHLTRLRKELLEIEQMIIDCKKKYSYQRTAFFR